MSRLLVKPLKQLWSHIASFKIMEIPKTAHVINLAWTYDMYLLNCKTKYEILNEKDGFNITDVPEGVFVFGLPSREETMHSPMSMNKESWFFAWNIKSNLQFSLQIDIYKFRQPVDWMWMYGVVDLNRLKKPVVVCWFLRSSKGSRWNGIPLVRLFGCHGKFLEITSMNRTLAYVSCKPLSNRRQLIGMFIFYQDCAICWKGCRNKIIITLD